MPITHPGRFGALAGIGAIAIALSVTAVACGGDDTPEPSGTPIPVATEAATATEEATPPETASPVADRTVGTGVGDLAPDFTLTKPDGGEITLSSLREQNRPFLLISFTTW
ncbi:MAG: hypothetical protein O7F09_01685 [Chloroflexi bacterium]|nr:hypothetical protein [Chloroflexota bacterium]